MAQLSRARDRSMHSIVATIQAEQDQAIRAPGKGVVSISGGPGTGKTVVALHRAAYLLYTDRRRYEGGGVLVVGPSGVFMRYIERVLPSPRRDRGRAALARRGRRRRPRDPPRRAGGRRRQGLGPDGRADAAYGAAAGARAARRSSGSSGATTRSCSTARMLGRLRRQLMAQGRRNRQLPRVASSLLDAMWRQVRGERGRERGREAFDDEMLSAAVVRRLRGRLVAAARRADGAVGWLRDPEFLARVGEGVSAPRSSVLLTKSWSATADRRPCRSRTCRCSTSCATRSATCPPRTEDDHELDDRSLGGDLQELTTAAEREYAPSGRAWAPPTHRIEDDGFAHVLIDEAQDLTPMQWRMVGRRGRAASWTIVGDPAQSSWPVPAESAAARAAALEGKELHEFHLSTNYRNSSEIYAYAAAYAERVGLDADLPTAVRSTGVEPRVVTGVADLEAATREAVADDRRPGRRHGRHRGAGRPPLRGQRLAGVVAGVRRRRPRARAPPSTPRSRRRARTGSWC